MSELSKLLKNKSENRQAANSANPSTDISNISRFSSLTDCDAHFVDNETRIAALRKQRAESGRRQRRDEVLTMLAENPGIKYAYATDIHAIPDQVLLTVAIRNLIDRYTGTFEMTIPAARYDAAKFLAFIDAEAK